MCSVEMQQAFDWCLGTATCKGHLGCVYKLPVSLFMQSIAYTTGFDKGHLALGG
jgi:hypothetical protein